MDPSTLVIVVGIIVAAVPAWALIRHRLDTVASAWEADIDRMLSETTDPADRLLALNDLLDELAISASCTTRVGATFGGFAALCISIVLIDLGLVEGRPLTLTLGVALATLPASAAFRQLAADEERKRLEARLAALEAGGAEDSPEWLPDHIPVEAHVEAQRTSGD